ncbi:thermonuclease family protein [Terrabacter sp. NPDC000476]|uniref:thermonuclease family protein n=1 Tax=Terrabacter sp. NPDC000476 TaxID=3154258 RepID=UPI00331699AE
MTLVALVVAAGLAGAAGRGTGADQPTTTSGQSGQSGTVSGPTWNVTKVVDGDTLWAERDGVTLKVRVIGIDTPEIGQCGYAEATGNLRAILGDRPVTLTAGARDDADRYGRALRYVDVGGLDAGLRQITQGYAVARYDSRDGYGRHPREDAYVRADAASPTAACADPAAAPATATAPTAANPGANPGTWPLPGDRHPCPRAEPVKGNENSMIAHAPGDRYYGITDAEQCFATMAAAEAAGFRPARG